jgi:3-dehydroquinate synthetase
MHDVIVVGLPVLAILAGIFFNNNCFDRLETCVDRVQSELNAKIEMVQSSLTTRIEKVQSDLTGRMDRMQADLGNFYGILGEHKAKIDNLEKQQ